MVTKDDLYGDEAEYRDIIEDVRLECAQYGRVHSVIIPRVKDGYSPESECLIFVEFDQVEGARAAANVLNGRKFADKIVVVSFVSCLYYFVCFPLRAFFLFAYCFLYFSPFFFFFFFFFLQYKEQDFAMQHLI